MRTIDEIEIGEIFQHPTRGKGKVIGITKRTITIKWPKSTQKTTFRHNHSEINILDF